MNPIFFYKQKVFIEKVISENPGLPLFCYAHSTGAAITLKVYSILETYL
jgi:alpha-beta hydrolase superfamily lysophospholipase